MPSVTRLKSIACGIAADADGKVVVVSLHGVTLCGGLADNRSLGLIQVSQLRSFERCPNHFKDASQKI